MIEMLKDYNAKEQLVKFGDKCCGCPEGNTKDVYEKKEYACNFTSIFTLCSLY